MHTPQTQTCTQSGTLARCAPNHATHAQPNTSSHHNSHAPSLGSLLRLPPPGPSPPPRDHCDWRRTVGCNHQSAKHQTHALTTMTAKSTSQTQSNTSTRPAPHQQSRGVTMCCIIPPPLSGPHGHAHFKSHVHTKRHSCTLRSKPRHSRETQHQQPPQPSHTIAWFTAAPAPTRALTTST